MCWKKKKQKSESYKKELSPRQPTLQGQHGSDIARHTGNASETRTPNDQQAAFGHGNVGNATRDSRENEKKSVKKKNTANSETPKEERSLCCSTQHTNMWTDAVSCGEDLILQNTQTTNDSHKDESCTSGEGTLVGIPAEMPFFQNEEKSNSECPALENTQESKERIGKDLCSAQHSSNGDTLEGVPSAMPNFQDE